MGKQLAFEFKPEMNKEEVREMVKIQNTITNYISRGLFNQARELAKDLEALVEDSQLRCARESLADMQEKPRLNKVIEAYFDLTPEEKVIFQDMKDTIVSKYGHTSYGDFLEQLRDR